MEYRSGQRTKPSLTRVFLERQLEILNAENGLALWGGIQDS
jgi:hypothetical protein